MGEVESTGAPALRRDLSWNPSFAISWVKYFSSLDCSFLICKMSLTRVSHSRVCVCPVRLK